MLIQQFRQNTSNTLLTDALVITDILREEVNTVYIIRTINIHELIQLSVPFTYPDYYYYICVNLMADTVSILLNLRQGK